MIVALWRVLMQAHDTLRIDRGSGLRHHSCCDRGMLITDRPHAGSPRHLANQLKLGIHPPDITFDRYLPEDLQAHSEIHWTTLAVASRVARWLGGLDVKSVVDIGSGAGKFCVAAALAGRCHYTGIEQRSRLVEVSRGLARLFEVEGRVRFVEGVLGEIDIPIADAYYLYNPFGENTLRPEQQLDQDVELGEERHERDVRQLTEFLKRLPPGTLVVTYHGFGGQMPEVLQEVRILRGYGGLLRLWRRVANR